MRIEVETLRFVLADALLRVFSSFANAACVIPRSVRNSLILVPYIPLYYSKMEYIIQEKIDKGGYYVRI